MAFTSPNYTQTPNAIFDHWLPILGFAELKVLMAIVRKTFGWHKAVDQISLSQLEKLTGLAPKNIRKAAKSLSDRGIIIKKVIGEKGKQDTYYQLVIDIDSNNSDQDRKVPTPPYTKYHTKETLPKEIKKDKSPSIPDLPNPTPKTEEKNDIASAKGERLNLPDKEKGESPEEQLKRVLTEEFQNLPEIIQIEALRVFKEARQTSNLKIQAFKKRGGEIKNPKPFVLKILRQTVESILSRERKKEDRKRKKFKSSKLVQ